MANVPDQVAIIAQPLPGQRQMAKLTSPLGMAIVIPLLVLITGLAIGVVNRVPLRHGAELAAADSFALSTERTRRRVSEVLGQSSVILDAMRALVRSHPPWNDDQSVASSLLGIIRGRAGLTSISWSTNDGNHLRVERVTHTYQFLRSAVSPAGRVPSTTWSLSNDGELTQPLPSDDSAYDPRKRPFYFAAITTNARTWTDPYLFFSTNVTGITCAEPLTIGPNTLGVIAVDFDLTSISAILDDIDRSEQAASFLFTKERVLLGLPSAWRSSVSPQQRLLTVQDVAVVDLQNYFTALPLLPEDDQLPPLFDLDILGESCGASVSAIHLPGGATWYLGLILRRSVLLGEADYYLRLSLIIGLFILALATAIAWWFARHLAKSRLAVVQANDRAVQAETKANELGAYRLIKLLGKGGMGEVWLAQHRMLARPAAIKLIKADTMEGREPERRKEIRLRFAAEARITANLHSINTIELYDYGISHDGTFYYVMELLDGIDLYDLVAKFGPLPPHRVVHFLRQACNSLAEAHDNGLVHRDIKPENLFVCRLSDDVDIIKVLDFGIVRIQNPTDNMPRTRVGLVQGTPATMSPEQATDQKLDGRSDLYSLGCVAYWLLTGRQVFEADSVMELLTHHVNTTPKPPSASTKQYIPPALDKLIMLLLAKDPAARPAHARACSDILKQLDMGQAIAWDEAKQQSWWKTHLPPRKLNIPMDGQSQLFAPGFQSN